MKSKSEKVSNKAANVLAVNQDEANQAINRARKLKKYVTEIEAKNDNQSQRLDSLLSSLDEIDLDAINLDGIDNAVSIENSQVESTFRLKPLMYMDTSQNFNFIFNESNKYAENCNLDLTNPYLAGLSEVEVNQLSSMLSEKYNFSSLDKWDYLFSSVAGIIGGLIDAFLVGSVVDGNKKGLTHNEQGIFGKISDDTCDKLIQKYATFESGKKMDSPKKAIRWLEKNHKVSYDASHNGRIVGSTVHGMNASNHHLLSLAHDPGPLGLFFGIVDQMDGKSTFISGGRLIRIITTSAESDAVLNQNGPMKVIKATQNWFGHICSDIGGSSGSKGRGAGLPVPFYNLTQELNFGNVKGEDKNFAEVAEWLYKQGEDCRAFTAQALPVIIMEALVRLYWVFKKHFYYGKNWKESISKANQISLQKMLLLATATFEATDMGDALIRNGFNVTALLRINFVGLLDLEFKSIQVLRGTVKKREKLDELDEDLQEEWARVYQSI